MGGQIAPSSAILSKISYKDLKESLVGKRCGSYDELFDNLDKSYNLNGLKKFEKRWMKGMELNEDYIQK